jgi:hypothetical protein
MIVGDPNLRDFYSRVTRIEKARAHGYGFEAPGTLGLSHYHRTTRKRMPIVGPLFVVIVMSLFLKGAILYKIGEATYETRVAELMSGSDFDKVGGWLMQADPATIWVSEKIRAAALAVAE